MKSAKIISVIFIGVCVVFAFTGTAVALDDINLGTVSVYKLYDNTTYPFNLVSIKDYPLEGSVWRSEAGNEVTFIKDGSKYCISAEGLTEDIYFCAVDGITHKFTLQYPTAPVTGFIYNGAERVSSLIGSTVDTDKSIEFIVPSAANALMFTNPANSLSSKSLTDFTAEGSYERYTNIKTLDTGMWAVQAVFEKDGINYTKLAPVTEILGKMYYFTVVKADTGRKLTASADEIKQAGYVSITLSAPYKEMPYLIVVENGRIFGNQTGISDAVYNEAACVGKANVTVPTTGNAVFTVQSTTTSDLKVKLMKSDGTTEDKSVTVSVTRGLITAKAKKSAYYIGDDVDLYGTSDFKSQIHFYVGGKNFDFTFLKTIDDGMDWSKSIETANLKDKNGKRPDAGTYTFYAVKLRDGVDKMTVTVEELDDYAICYAYAVVSVDLTPQSISLTSVTDIIPQGSEFKAVGRAEGTLKKVQYYIFGTNYFASDYETVSSEKFTIKLPGEITNEMQSGQYFMIIQHPMYDKNFNIGAERDSFENLTGNILLNKVNDVMYGGDILFNTASRQSANAAEALCQALDSEDIDDMYVKASFLISSKDSYINPIPAQVVKGDVLSVSGTAYGYKDKVVVGELISTAFTAVSKRDLSPAAFASSSTVIESEYGMWEITFDTSNLNVDDYTVSISVAGLSPEISTIKIVDLNDVSAALDAESAPAENPTAIPVKPAQTSASPAPVLGILAGLCAVFFGFRKSKI